jgi:phage terminase large subunit GpA-like protein
MNIADGYAEIVKSALRGARPDPELQVDAWSEEHMVLPKSSSEPGPYRIERTPYARRVLQVLSPGHPSKRVVVKAASQMLKTQTAINWLLASIHLAPANILALEPTDKLAKRLSARMSSSIKDVPVVAAAVAQPRSRDSRNTIDAKDFKGGALYITTAGAASNLAEIPARYVYLDEVDRMESSVEGEGDPVELAEARTTTFSSNCKIYATSSPTVENASKIDTLFAMGTRESYHVPCPHCGHLHELVLGNFHFERDPETGYMARAWFVCPGCGCEIDERHKGTMLKDEALGGHARWVADGPGDGETVSFTISAFYAKPGDISWLALARQYARALERLERGDSDAMRVFYNTRLALSYNDTIGATTAEQLMERAKCETYRLRQIPDAALVLTMSVDTQPDRLECQIEAWGPGLEHWVMDYQVLQGDPQDPPSRAGSVWQRLDALRRQPLYHVSGVPIYISAYGIDSGGHNTQDVYNYGTERERMGCVILKGANRPGKPIISGLPSKMDVDWNGKRIEHGAKLWWVGTDTGKDWLYGRMKLVSGPGAMHMHVDLGKAWFEGMTCERPKRKLTKRGKVVTEWINPPGARNEPWDCSNYNLAIAHKLGLHKWTEKDWQHLRSKLIPTQRTPDLFSEQPEQPPAEVIELEGEAEQASIQDAPQVHVQEIEQPSSPADGVIEVMDSAAAVEELAPETVPTSPVEPAQADPPQPIAEPLPLYPFNPMQVRRRRIRSRGI